MQKQLLIQMLKDRNLTITTAESCTGGMIASALVDVPQASMVFREAMVTYANEAKKSRLGVSEETLSTYGAVSEQTAREMALGACRYANADLSIASTGIAGPDGGTKEKPVGLVYLACAWRETVFVKKCFFQGDRTQIRRQAVKEGILLACEVLEHAEKEKK